MRCTDVARSLDRHWQRPPALAVIAPRIPALARRTRHQTAQCAVPESAQSAVISNHAWHFATAGLIQGHALLAARIAETGRTEGVATRAGVV